MFGGIDAAMLMLRATRTRRPARSISISVRLVSSSSNASSRISALSSLLNIADVYFDGRNFYRHQRVMQRDRCMRIGSGIEDDSGCFPGMGFVDEIDQFAFAIGLPAIGFQAEFRSGLRAKLLDVGELGMAVGLGLAGPQQIEVRAVEHVNRLGKTLGHPDPGNVATESDSTELNQTLSLSFCLSMISGQTLRVCPEGKPVSTFPDHAPGGGVIGNNGPKGKPLGRLVPPSNASSDCKKGAQNLR